MKNIDEVMKSIAKAEDAVGRICQGADRWTMSIPVRPDHDHDIIICHALNESREAITELRAEVDRLNDWAIEYYKEMRAALGAAEKDAARYRFLKERDTSEGFEIVLKLRGKFWDEAIDAVMKAEQ